MKLADTPGRVYRMGVPVQTARDYATAWQTAPEPTPKPAITWPFPLVRGTDGKPVIPVWRTNAGANA
jgi:hypothetical protein